ncbi:MAG: hypothetical protein QUS66_02955 [Bacteroidota bacterium]|nr:hypothetical protein [Bacteroidota bacterium]
MKRITTILPALIMMTAAALSLSAQGPGQGMGQGAMQGDGEKLTAYKIAFFTKNLNLTPAEAEKFWPLYNDYSARKNKLQADRLLLMRYAAQNEANMSEGEFTSTADKLSQSFADEASMVVSFNESLKKVLPPAKVIRLYQVENQYKQQLLRELNQRRQGAPQPGIRGRAGQAGTPGIQE